MCRYGTRKKTGTHDVMGSGARFKDQQRAGQPGLKDQQQAGQQPGLTTSSKRVGDGRNSTEPGSEQVSAWLTKAIDS